MNKAMTHFLLKNGQKMPRFGLGTYLAENDSEVDTFVSAVTEIGYRHIDTAAYYKNETQVGTALKAIFDKGIKREELFIVTKLWNSDHGRAQEALKESLARLQLDYVDLYLIHCPVATIEEGDKVSLARVPLSKTWTDLETCVDKGLTRGLGVSNFNFQLLNDLLAYARHAPLCNQIELNPYLSQHRFVEWMKSQDVQPVAFAPLGKGYLVEDPKNLVLNDPLIHQLAKKYGRSVGQILLNWSLARGHAVIPKSSNMLRLKENFESQAFQMDQADIEAINKLNRNFRLLAGTFREGVFDYPMFE